MFLSNCRSDLSCSIRSLVLSDLMPLCGTTIAFYTTRRANPCEDDVCKKG